MSGCSFLGSDDLSRGAGKHGFGVHERRQGQVAQGPLREAGSRIPMHRGGHIPSQSSVGRKKGAPILTAWLQTAAPSHSCQSRPPPWHCSWHVIPGHGLPQPPSPQTTVPFSPAFSDLPLLTPALSSAPSSGETQPLSLSPRALDGAGPTPEQPEPGQQRFHHVVSEQPEHQGPPGLGMG